MPDGNHSDHAVSNKSHAQDTRASRHIPASSSSRTSSSVSSRSRRPSPSPAGSHGASHTPLTPEESPPFRTTRKRTAGIVETEDRPPEHAEASSPARTRSSSGDIHVCICQPDPKIPRPRNAFILYRQHHQAQVVSANPGLANPEISKIIGEQWQNQPPEVKNRWKQLAEEEKLRHQQQYPTYRYQPKRSGRRNSLSSEACSAVEKPRCHKCGGRSILAPSTPYSNTNSTGNSPASAHTPASAITPVTRTLPVLKDLCLQSPAARRMRRPFPNSTMSPGPHGYSDERDDLAPLSPDLKRRRYNGEHPATMSRALPPRYAVASSAQPGPPVGPGTPFPFAQGPPHPYPPGAAAAHVRRESLPGLRGVVSPPVPMAPPPRPGPGYQQHRLSQGHIPHDRSLTLPPLQTGSTAGGVTSAITTAGAGKTAKEQIMKLDFWYKVKVLGQVAPPKPVKSSAPRGPFVAIEGDSPDAVKALGTWLAETLGKGDDLSVKQLDGPVVTSEGSKEQIMAQYHRLAADWLLKSANIVDSLAIKTASPIDSVMVDAPHNNANKTSREMDEQDEKNEDSSSSTTNGNGGGTATAGAGNNDEPHNTASSDKISSRSHSSEGAAEKMDVDNTARKTSLASLSPISSASSSSKPVSIVPNYSLYASNFFACHIPIESHARYSPKDHWEWTATHWRGITSPDLTIYVRDGIVGADTGKQSVEIMDEGNLFVVKRTYGGEGKLEVEPSTLRRLVFEVSEWVRAFGTNGGSKMEA